MHRFGHVQASRPHHEEVVKKIMRPFEGDVKTKMRAHSSFLHNTSFLETTMKPLTRIVIAGAVLALANPDCARAQDAIVKLDARPKKPAFGAWNKPTVLRSADDAAKHFDEDALKKMDFKKQIVLIFAWQGSGQDKLSYTVAESFPEQITFSRKPGLTRDLRQHVQVFALRSNVKWSVQGAAGAKAKGGEKPAAVRPLKFKAADPTILFNLGGKASATALADAGSVEKLVGKQSAKDLIDQANFEKEMIVFVSWNTSGPPDGKLMHELKDRKLTFYVQGPKGGGARGQRLRIGADFFAVPRGVNVAFDPKER